MCKLHNNIIIIFPSLLLTDNQWWYDIVPSFVNTNYSQKNVVKFAAHFIPSLQLWFLARATSVTYHKLSKIKPFLICFISFDVTGQRTRMGCRSRRRTWRRSRDDSRLTHTSITSCVYINL